jgi:hypothetical protein
MRAELAPIGGDGLAAVECRATTLYFARPRLVNVVLIRIVKTLEEPRF